MAEKQKKKNLMSFLAHYKGLVALVIVFSLVMNILTLLLPRITARAIDDIRELTYNRDDYLILFGGVVAAIFVIGILQNFASSYTTELIAAELRRQLVEKISKQSYRFVNKVTPSRLLTNLTADVDAVKQFISQGLVIAFAAVVQLIGSAILLLYINWKLAIPVIAAVPILLVSFGVIFSLIEKYFKKAQETIDRLNMVINESIVGAALIRVLHSRKYEINKFSTVNKDAYEIGIKIVNGFAALIPVITIIINAAFLVVLGYGGSQVIDGTLSNGDFASFFSYIFTFIVPVILLGFLGSTVSRAFVTYDRLQEVLDAEDPIHAGTVKKEIEGNIKLENITIEIDNKKIVKDVSFEIKPKNKVAIIGPTASGKTQIFYIISGLIDPTEGKYLIDGVSATDYDMNNLYSQLGMVFQDSLIFNTTIRENIAFDNTISDEQIWKVLEVADLADYVKQLPDGLDTLISERGTTLSGGQKQRLTLARALALNPKILLLDDFTARVDIKTEQRIFENIKNNYPDITIVAITQKISSVKDFDNIILMMEGELLAQGKHEELLEKSFEYKQIFNSQRATQ